MSKYNGSFIDAYRHLNTEYKFGEDLDDMEILADLVIYRNYGLHRLMSAVYRKSVGCGRCVDSDEARTLIEELVSLL